MFFDYSDCSDSIRGDLPEAHQWYWDQLARPGAWWTGAQRVAIARESRLAWDCSLCQERKSALSPYGGEAHQARGELSAQAVDAVHRVVTDQQRITGSYIEACDQAGLSQGAYVELVGIVVAVLSVDEFHRAMGLALEVLPSPIAGDPSGHRPERLANDIGFVPTVPPDGAVGAEADLWPEGRSANVLRALTLVPDALRDWLRLSDAQYLSVAEMMNFDQPANRSLNRMQIELVAGRVSSINECFY